jgi:hypothetical protein
MLPLSREVEDLHIFASIVVALPSEAHSCTYSQSTYVQIGITTLVYKMPFPQPRYHYCVTEVIGMF